MILPIPYKYLAMLTLSHRENITIPANPRTCRPVGYAFVTVSTPGEADRAISQLSGNVILERKVSIQRARAEERKDANSGATAVEEEVFATRNKAMEDYPGNRSDNIEKGLEESKTLHAVSETVAPQDVQAASPVNWNAVNFIKIRTTLGGSVGKIKDFADEPNLTNGSGKRMNGRSDRDLGELIPL